MSAALVAIPVTFIGVLVTVLIMTNRSQNEKRPEPLTVPTIKRNSGSNNPPAVQRETPVSTTQQVPLLQQRQQQVRARVSFTVPAPSSQQPAQQPRPYQGQQGYYAAFGYGSLHPKDMEVRVGILEFDPIAAKVINYKRCFQGWSSKRECSPANIKYQRGAQVYGLIYILNEQQLKKLRSSEGYKPEKDGRFRVMGRNEETNTYSEMIIPKPNSLLNDNDRKKQLPNGIIKQKVGDNYVNFDKEVYVYVINEKKDRSTEFNVYNQYAENFIKYLKEVHKTLKESTGKHENNIKIDIYDSTLTKRGQWSLQGLV
jgi:hypothetical protein